MPAHPPFSLQVIAKGHLLLEFKINVAEENAVRGK